MYIPLCVFLQASQEFGLVRQCEPIREEFEEKFPLWAKAILRYCRETQVKSSALQLETVDFNDDLEDGL